MEVEPSVLAVSEILEGIEPADRRWLERARERTAGLLMPTRALGRLHDIAERLCAIGNTLQPEIARKGVLVMAGDHGVVAEGVSAYPQEITGEMVRAFLAGGAGINVLSRQVGAEVRVVDLGIIPDLDPQQMEGGKGLWVRKVGHGTGNLARGAAMSRDQAARAILAGFDSASRFFRDGVQILGTGDMGIGNTTPSAAIGCVLTGASPEDMVGRGTGVDDAGLGRKRDAVARGIAQNRPDPTDALGVLATVGGFEIGGITGCVLAGAFHGRPVVIDGFISTAGALIAHALCPAVSDYLFAGHCSEERGHRLMLSHLGLEPILALGMRLGEGTGAVLAMGIMEGAVRILREMMTFEDVAIPGR